MQVYLIRHSALNVASSLCYGQSEVPLADDFAQASQAIIDKIPAPIDRVYSSTSTRCELLAQKFGQPVHLDKRLMEYHYGDFEGQHWHELSALPAFIKWCENWQEEAPPNGESFLQFTTRVNAFIEELRTQQAKHVVVVTHHGVIRAVMMAILHFNATKFFTLRFDYGQIVKLELSQNGQFDQVLFPTS